MRIAVCLASYNGEKFIRAQLVSILAELGPDDLVIVSDDGSSDGTLCVVRAFGDPRIKLICNSVNLGYIKNFESAASKADADFIFFSDQDDLWVHGRVNKMIDSLIRQQKNILFGKFKLIGDLSSRLAIKHGAAQPKGAIQNLTNIFFGRSQFPYYGCTMVMTAKAKLYLFPIPLNGISHDVWAAVIGNIKMDIAHLDEVVTSRRIHDDNLTKSNRSLVAKVVTRIKWIAGLLIYFLDIRRE